MQLVIYKITNLINNKIYIGKTKNFHNRILQHKNTKGYKSCISRAIKKYGEENFSFEIIDTAKNETELSNLEYNYILQYNSIIPNGYNIFYKTKQKVIIPKRTIKKQILNSKKQNINNYKGVYFYPAKKKYSAIIRSNGISYEKTFDNLIKAAEFYDMLTMYLYGKDCIINFPEKLEIYISRNYKKIIKRFLKTRRRWGKLRGCSFNKEINKYRCYININGRMVDLGYFKYQKAAGLIRDIAILYNKKQNKLNYPEIKNIKMEKIVFLYKKYLYKQSSDIKYINFNKRNKKWRAYFPLGNKKYKHLGWFSSKDDAILALNSYKIITGIV
jgi:group I intron endonuclease